VLIQHDRADLALEKLWMAFYCLPRDGRPAVDIAQCGELSVGGEPSESTAEFPATSTNRVDTKPVSFRFTHPDEHIFCIGMKVLFQGVPNQIDSTLYVTLDDRYSILSYCTEPTLPSQHASQPRWAHRREPTFSLFLARFSQPIALALKPEN
jgi:hypothetical protein